MISFSLLEIDCMFAFLRRARAQNGRTEEPFCRSWWPNSGLMLEGISYKGLPMPFDAPCCRTGPASQKALKAQNGWSRLTKTTLLLRVSYSSICFEFIGFRFGATITAFRGSSRTWNLSWGRWGQGERKVRTQGAELLCHDLFPQIQSITRTSERMRTSCLRSWLFVRQNVKIIANTCTMERQGAGGKGWAKLELKQLKQLKQLKLLSSALNPEAHEASAKSCIAHVASLLIVCVPCVWLGNLRVTTTLPVNSCACSALQKGEEPYRLTEFQ